MNPFNNPQIDIEDLPRSEDLQYSGLETDYRSVQIISNCIFWLFFGVAFGIGFLFAIPVPKLLFYIIAAIGVALIIFSFISIFVGFRKKQYAIRDKDIHYKRGWIWTSHTVIPFKRIQHSEVVQGPVDRMFDLAKIRIFTAGGSNSDLTIPGLRVGNANQIKDLITSRIATTRKPVLTNEEE